MSTVTGTNSPILAAPAAPPRPWTRARVAGLLLLLFWICAAAGLVAYLDLAWDVDKVVKYGPKLWSGLQVTIGLVSLSIVVGAIISFPVALGRMSKNPILSRLAFAYVYTFRGTPLIAQLFLIYYGLGEFRQTLEAVQFPVPHFAEWIQIAPKSLSQYVQLDLPVLSTISIGYVSLWDFFRDAWNCALFAFTLNTAAYQAEILRGAIESVPRGQWEGAYALGLSRVATFRKVILPQALIVALRPYGNEIILMIKGSAIVALVTVFDLMGETRRAFSRTYDFQMYLWAALLYFVMVEALRNIWNLLEARLTRHLVR